MKTEDRPVSGFAEIDRHFAKFVARFGGGVWTEKAALHLSRAVRKGHICLDLGIAPESEIDSEAAWLGIDDWRKTLRECRAVAAPGVEPITPLVLDKAGRLYLRRYYNYEQGLANSLLRRVVNTGQSVASDQDGAVEAALRQSLTVISGGPGTGKTTTVVRILARLLEQTPGARIALAAPTGKAAARLDQAVRENWSRFATGSAADSTERIPKAATLHRLLGVRPRSAGFRHNAGNPLAIDLLVVDEASMVALPLMAKLFDAVPENARVILLGDRDQLASVEPGSVLADIADAAGENTPLSSALVVLRQNYRFGHESGIARLCETVRAGDVQKALEIIGGPAQQDLGGAALPARSALAKQLRVPVLEGFGAFAGESDPALALAAFNRFRILCAVREGTYGVRELNRQVESLLREAGLTHGSGLNYAGMPVLVTRNDYQVGLFNGDIGVFLPDPLSGKTDSEPALWAWFPGESAGDPPRRVAPARLPEHEPAYAMTVHKSQGSEFERVLLVLPDRDTPVLTRELVYTGLTRARQRVDVWFAASSFASAVARRVARTSGLRDALVSP